MFYLPAEPFDPSVFADRLLSPHPELQELFRLLGYLPSTNQLHPIPELRSRSFLNIGEHAIAVALVSQILAEALQRVDKLSPAEVTAITLRGLIHDIRKSIEISLRVPGQDSESDPSFSARVEDKFSAVLQQIGVPTQLHLQLSSAGAETGCTGLIGLIDRWGGRCSIEAPRPRWRTKPWTRFDVAPQSFAHKIVRYADDAICSTTPIAGRMVYTSVMTPADRLLASGSYEKYPEMSVEGLGEVTPKALSYLRDVRNGTSGSVPIVGTQDVLSIAIGEQIALEICTVAKITGPINFTASQILTTYIRNQIAARL